MRKPIIVQHSFGAPGSGGPVTAMERALESDLRDKYEFVRMHQGRATGKPSPGLIGEWVRMLRRVDPDLIHVRGLGNEGFQGVLAARLASVPRILVSIHGTVRDLVGDVGSWRRRALVYGAEPATLRMATHIVTVCRAASGRAFLDPYRNKLVGELVNGVPLPARSGEKRRHVRVALDIDPAVVVLVVVGRLSIDKGHLILAEALRQLAVPERRPTLLVVGDGPDRALIEAAYRTVPSVNVRMLGRRMDVPALLQASDVFVFPTLHENLSNALLEAMAAGLPVVATRVGGNVEVLERGGGELVPAGDPYKLREAVTRLVLDPDLRRRYGADARRVVEEGYTLAHMADRINQLYKSILNGDGGAWIRSR